MLSLISIIVFIMGNSLFAESCEMSLKKGDQLYCVELDWLPAERSTPSGFEPTETLSPVLIQAGSLPPTWHFSRLQIRLYKHADESQLPQIIDGISFYPYMVMANGHHHSTSHEFFVDKDNGFYELGAMAFQAMRGCWSLRYVIEGQSSQLLTSLTDFTNLDSLEKSEQLQMCLEFTI